MHARSPCRSTLLSCALALLAVTGISACGDEGAPESEPTSTTVSSTSDAAAVSSDDEVPEILEVAATSTDGAAYRFDVTISSPYDRADKYADAWRVVGPDGTVYGTRELTHPHTDEQPFTRSLDGVEIPDDVTSVTIEARDLVDGWTATPVEFDLER